MPSARAALRALRAHAGAAALSGGALLAGIVLAAFAAGHGPLPGDLSATRTVQEWPFPGETLSDVVRAVTGTEVVVVIGLVLSVVALRFGHRRPVLAFALGLCAVVLLQFLLKEIVDRPRPSPELIDLRAGFTSLSFPSGHTMSATYVYGFVALGVLATPYRVTIRVAAAIVVAVFLALGGLANVYLGVHWSSDVIGGYLWALAVLIPAAVATFPNVVGRPSGTLRPRGD